MFVCGQQDDGAEGTVEEDDVPPAANTRSATKYAQDVSKRCGLSPCSCSI